MSQNLINFPNDVIACTVNVPVQYSQYDIDNIVVGAIEGGISYWGYIKNVTGIKPSDTFLSQWCTKCLLDGKSITIGEHGEEDKYELTLTKLISGIEQNHTKRPSSDKEQYDAEDYDCIFQYALFGKLVYG